MFGSKFNLGEIERNLQSPKQEIRGAAMQNLLLEARKNSRIHQPALPLFEAAVKNPQDSWTTINAARGIELIAGSDRAGPIWLTLLNSPREDLAAAVALTIRDPAYVPALIRLLSDRPETKLRISVIRALGRLKDSAILSALTQYLSCAELCPHVVEALADLGDPKATPHLEPLRTDASPAWKEDNHGPMLRVCDLVATALQRLNADN